MKNILIYDTETTGLNTDTDEIFEMAWAIMDADKKVPIHLHTNFLQLKTPLSDEIRSITRMEQVWVDNFGESPREVYELFLSDIAKYDVGFICGHNIIEYDNKILQANMERAGIVNLQKLFSEMVIIDTITDLPYEYPTKKLSYIAAELGFLNPFPHRALFDVSVCMKLLQIFDLKEIVALASNPVIEVRAMVSYDNRALASKRKYQWNANKKIWTKKIKECHFEKESSHNDFNVERL